MYAKPPGASDPSADKALQGQAPGQAAIAFDLRQIREHDLLILS